LNGSCEYVGGIVPQFTRFQPYNSERFLNKALSDVSSSSDTTPILLRFTDQVRADVSQTLEQLGLPVPIMIDVTIDDIR